MANDGETDRPPNNLITRMPEFEHFTAEGSGRWTLPMAAAWFIWRDLAAVDDQWKILTGAWAPAFDPPIYILSHHRRQPGTLACVFQQAGFACGKVYQLREKWLREFNVDIAIPRAFYRDLLVYAPTCLMMPEDRDALLNARRERDGGKTLRIFDDADGSFFAQMSAVVGSALRSPPTSLPAKVMGEVTAIQGEGRSPLPPVGASAKNPQGGSTASPAFRGAPPRGKAQLPTSPAAVGQKRVDPPSRKGNASSTAPKTRGRPRAPKRGTWLPEGIDDRSSVQELHGAVHDLNRRMKEDLPQDELWTLMEQCEHVQDLIVHRKDRVKRQQQIRRKNKAAARLKRMGG